MSRATFINSSVSKATGLTNNGHIKESMSKWQDDNSYKSGSFDKSCISIFIILFNLKFVEMSIEFYDDELVVEGNYL